METNNKSSIEKTHSLIGIVIGALSILGIAYYMIGYAFYSGLLSVYGLAPNLSPLMFDDYIAMGFAATFIAFSNMFTSLISVAALLSFIVVCWFITALLMNYKSKLNPSPEWLSRLVQKIISFFSPAKDFFLSYLGLIAFAAWLFQFFFYWQFHRFYSLKLVKT